MLAESRRVVLHSQRALRDSHAPTADLRWSDGGLRGTDGSAERAAPVFSTTSAMGSRASGSSTVSRSRRGSAKTHCARSPRPDAEVAPGRM